MTSLKLFRLFPASFLILWLLGSQECLFAAHLNAEAQCEIIKEALYSDNPAKQILMLKKRNINLNQLCDYPYGDSFASFPPLIYAVRHLDLPAIKALVESGANVNLPDENGATSLMLAKDLSTVQFLLKSGANVNAAKGWPPLLWHITSRDDDAARIVDLLIRAGAKVNQRNDNADTALTLAAYNENNDMVRLLIKAKADLNMVNGNQDSALMIAARQGKSKTIELLIAANANPSLKNKAGESALDLAVKSGNRDAIALIESVLKKLANSGTQKVLGQTTDKSRESTQRLVRIKMHDGNILSGEIVRENDIDLILLSDGNRFQIKKSDIKKRELLAQ